MVYTKRLAYHTTLTSQKWHTQGKKTSWGVKPRNIFAFLILIYKVVQI
jgi:hypothetical protein